MVGSGVAHGGAAFEAALVAIDAGEIAGHAQNHRDPQIGVQAVDRGQVVMHLLLFLGRVSNHHAQPDKGIHGFRDRLACLHSGKGLVAQQGQGAALG